MALTVYLDLDGTIISVVERYYQVHRRLAEDLRQEPLSKAEYWGLRQQRIPTAEILAGWPSWAKARYEEQWPRMIEEPAFLRFDEPLPGATACLTRLSTQRRLALVTLRRNLSGLHEQLWHLGIGNLFSRVLARADRDGGGWRAKAELVAEDKEVQNGQAVLVGDTEADVLAGKRLGMPTVAVLSGIRTREFLEELRPDALLADITGLPDLLVCWQLDPVAGR